MVSKYEVLEAIWKYKKLSTKKIAILLGCRTTQITRTLKKLEGEGRIKRAGVEMGGRGKPTIVWALADWLERKMIREGYKSFYDLPIAKEIEMKRGKPFVRI